MANWFEYIRIAMQGAINIARVSKYKIVDRIGNQNPKTGIRPSFGQFWNPESEFGIGYFDSGFGFLIVRLKLRLEFFCSKYIFQILPRSFWPL